MMRVFIVIFLLSSRLGITSAMEQEGGLQKSNNQYKYWIPGWIVSLARNYPITYGNETWSFGERQYLTSWSWTGCAEYNARSTKWTYK